MKVILTENQYKKLLRESFKSTVSNVLSNVSEFTLKVIKDATQQLKFDFRFLLTYGSGIGAILKSVYEYLEGNFVGLSTNEISGLTVMAVAVVFYENKDLKELLNKVDSSKLSNAVSYTDNLKNRFTHLLKVLGLSIHRTSNIISYSFLVPVLSILIEVVTKHGIESTQFDMLVEALSISVAVAIPGVAIRDILFKAGEMIENKTNDLDI
jgi:hypothetical protein